MTQQLQDESADQQKPLPCVFMPAQLPQTASPFTLHAFRVLFLTPAGRLIWLECKRKSLPEMALLHQIAAVVDGLSDESERMIAVTKSRIQAAHDVLFLDSNFLLESQWQIEPWARQEIMSRLAGSSHYDLATLRDEVTASLRRCLSEQLAAFCAHLDAEVLALVAQSASATCDLYNLIFSDGGIRRRNRIQAIRAFPFLLNVMHRDQVATLRDVIDDGRPLIPALAAHFGLSEALIKKIGKSTLPNLPGILNNPDFVFPLFVKTPLEKVPHDAAGWHEFGALVEQIARLIEQPVSTELGRALLIECLSNKEAKRIITGKLWREKYQAIKHLLHGLSSMTRYIYMKNHSHLEAEARSRTIVPSVIFHLSLRELVMIASKWNDAYREAEAFYAEQNGFFRGESWPALIKEGFDAGYYLIEPMDSVQKLGHEGKLMHNCVASYIPDCRSGRCQIWSIRPKGSTKPVANMQTMIEPVQSGTTYALRMVQIEAANNKRADQYMVEAGEKLIRSLSANQASLQTYLKWKAKINAVSKDDRIEFASARTVCRAIVHATSGRVDINRLLQDLMGKDFDQSRLQQLLAQNGEES